MLHIAAVCLSDLVHLKCSHTLCMILADQFNSVIFNLHSNLIQIK